MTEISEWLRGLGLERYQQAFDQNDIDLEVLPSLTSDDLVELGITSIGHRRKLLSALETLRAAPAVSDTESMARPAAEGAPAAPANDAERRQLTVMFCDLVGSTELSSRVDVEDLREIIASYHSTVAAAVGRFGGFVAKYMGDGVLVYFGYPRADEDDAERAVLAGLEAVAAIGALPAKAIGELKCRVGIATGLVVVGDLLGTGVAQEQAVVGETPNLAARLQSLAEPNTVVIAQSTRMLIGNLFECRDLGATELKGFANRAHIWQVLRRAAGDNRFEALRTTGALTPLVGREEELELILRRWEQARAGQGRVVLLSGEPGIGKSRCVAAVIERLQEPHLRLRYFCSPHRQDSALYPFIEQLQRAAGFGRDDPPETKLDKLEALLSRSATDLDRDAALLADLLALPSGDRYPPLTLDPQRKRR